MRTRVALAALAALLIPTLFAQSTPAGGIPPLEVSGDLAPGGTVTVSGSQCFNTDEGGIAGGAEVTVRIFGGDPPANVAFATLTADDEGDWSTQLTIDVEAQPGADYTIGASCDWFSVGDPVSFDYPDYDFVMGDAVTPTTATTAPGGETTASPAPSSTGRAGAVSTQPRFTG